MTHQHGRPARCAIYQVEPLAVGLRFTLDADDGDGKPMYHVYGGKLDGALELARIDPITIESTLKRDGRQIDRWTRTIQPGGETMLIAQHGFKPDGEPFRNHGIYRRIRPSD